MINLNPSRHYIIILLIILSQHKTFSQIKFQIERRPEEYKFVRDDKGNTAIFLKDMHQYQFAILDSNGKELKNKTIKRVGEHSNESRSFTAATYNNKGFYFYFRDTKKIKGEYFSSYFISLDNENDVEFKSENIFPDEEEELVKAFSANNFYYLVSVKEKEKQVNFFKFLNGRDYKKYSFSIKDEKLFPFSINSSVIRKDQFVNFSKLIYATKLYAEAENKFVVVADNGKVPENYKQSKTFIFSFDLENNTFESAYLNHNIRTSTSNSWLLEDKIFQFIQSEGKLEFLIYNYPQVSLLKKYQYLKGQKITFAQSEFYQKKEATGILEGGKEFDVLEKDRRIFNSLSNGTPYVQAERDHDDNISLLFGTQNVVTNAYSPMYVPMHVGGQFIGVHGSSTKVITTWFNTTIDKSTYEVMEKQPLKPDYIKVEEYMEELSKREVSKNSVTAIKAGGKIFVGYFLKKERAIRIEEIVEGI
jgi:hypothetical protein